MKIREAFEVVFFAILFLFLGIIAFLSGNVIIKSIIAFILTGFTFIVIPLILFGVILQNQQRSKLKIEYKNLIFTNFQLLLLVILNGILSAILIINIGVEIDFEFLENVGYEILGGVFTALFFVVLEQIVSQRIGSLLSLNPTEDEKNTE